MPKREILNRGIKLPASIKAARVELTPYSPMPFSSLTARSAHTLGDRFTEEPNEYTDEDAAFIEELLGKISNSGERTARAVAAARNNPAV